MEPRIPIPREQIEAFCIKWKITEFSLFGSVLREDFKPDSDIDVLVTFSKDASWSLFDLVEMQDELKILFGRDVDLLQRRGVERSRNYLRRRAILSETYAVYGS